MIPLLILIVKWGIIIKTSFIKINNWNCHIKEPQKMRLIQATTDSVKANTIWINQKEKECTFRVKFNVAHVAHVQTYFVNRESTEISICISQSRTIILLCRLSITRRLQIKSNCRLTNDFYSISFHPSRLFLFVLQLLYATWLWCL